MRSRRQVGQSTRLAVRTVSIGGIVASAPCLLAGAALSTVLEYLWLIIGYGIADPLVGKGYLNQSVLFAMVASCIVALIIFRAPSFTEAMRHSQGFSLIVGIVCSAASPALHFSLSGVVPDEIKFALNIIITACLVWLVYLIVRIMAEQRSFMGIGFALYISVMLSFLVNGLVMLNGDTSIWCVVLFSVLPFAGAILVVFAAWFARASDSSPASQFWFVNRQTAESINSEHALVTSEADAQKVDAALRAKTRHAFIRLLAALFVFCFYIAFVRSIGLDDSTGMESHSVGASSSLGIMAMFSLVMAGVMLVSCSLPPTREFYIISGFGMAFAALMMLVSEQGNFAIVRIIENISYMLFFFSMLYALLVYLAKNRTSPAKTLASALFFVAAGNGCGWAVNLVLEGVSLDESLMPIILLIITFIVLTSMFFCFPPSEYNVLVAPDLLARNEKRLLQDVSRETSNVDADEHAYAGDDERDTLGENANVDVDEGASASASETPIEGASVNLKATDTIAQEFDLSKRELDILRYLAQGWSDQYIADALTLSYHTVRSHIRHIYVKCDVHNRDELLNLVEAYG